MAELNESCGMSTGEIFELEHAARSGQTKSLSEDPESQGLSPKDEPATDKDEVEARVDTGILMRRLEKFFATLPERDRNVIDSYLGIGLTPVQLAKSMKIHPSRVSQLYKSICGRIGIHLGHDAAERSTDRAHVGAAAQFEELIALREAELARASTAGTWGQLVENVLTAPHDAIDCEAYEGPIAITSATRWG
jgi:RNA polymerase sigma factor for flagellar operon FliA